MKRASFALVLAVALAGVSPALATDALTGVAKVIDGDTIEIVGQRIRLFRIDAPDSGHRRVPDCRGEPKRLP